MHNKTVSVLLLKLLLIGMLTLTFNIRHVKAESPCIAVVPGSTIDPALTPGTNYTISVYTDYNGDDVWGYQFELAYNPQVLEGLEVVNGDLITEDVAPIAWFLGTFNNTSGILKLTGCFFLKLGLPKPLTSGPGTLAFVTFKVIGAGDSNLTLQAPGPFTTRLYGFTDGGNGVLYNIIDAETMPDHIQHGFFSNEQDIVAATIDIALDTLNLRSGGQWITCYIELPEGYNVSDIDVSTVMLEDTIPVYLMDVPAPHPVPTEIGDYDNDTVPDLMVKFNRTLVAELILSNSLTDDHVPLTITGEVAGTPFSGEATIEVILGAGGSKSRK